MFAPSLLITLREGLEAALILGITLGYLRKFDQSRNARFVWMGAAVAGLLSIGLAVLLQSAGMRLEGRGEQIFEGATMFLAVAVLTWMVFWMSAQARWMRASIERNVQRALEGGRAIGLALLAFVAVLREGVETALFLSAAAFATKGGGTLLGGLAGLALAALLGYLFFASVRHLNPRPFFRVTSLLLLLFAAGLLAHGVHEFQEAGLIPTWKAQVWDLNPLLDEGSFLGSLLKALFGYNGNPSLEEVISYLAYWVAAWFGLRWWIERRFSNKKPVT